MADARAVLSFTRWPNPLMLSYFVPGLLLVVVSMLGFLIDPKSTPARVALGIIGILAVLTNSAARPAAKPRAGGRPSLAPPPSTAAATRTAPS